MEKLSEKARRLLEFLREDYKDSGYMYSGSWPYESLIEHGFGKEVIYELRDAGFIQRRDCEDYAFELSPEERGKLIADHSLVSAWYEKVGDAMLLEIQREVRHASSVVPGKDAGMVTVDVVKNDGDMEKPDRVEVYCPLAVGQVVNLEYDLPKKMRWAGNLASYSSSGKAVGQFMVTYVAHNMLFLPGKNMLEVQSLCEEFNKRHPQNRMMMVFEDDLLKRMKDLDSNLEQKLQNAVERSEQAVSMKETKVLSFVDDVGFTKFSVDAGWYEMQENKDDVADLFEKASFDEDSGFKDLTGKYLEPELDFN